ncbi:MAG: response regulator [Chitinophagaceae bacterium]
MKAFLLLVDDNEEILEFLEHELNEKYTILKAHDGQEALNVLAENAIQLVIADVMMPVMDGFELCGIIKTSFEYSHIPVILLTARNTLQAKIEGLEMGADAYIEKPFSPEYLQVQIANLLTNRNKIKEYFASSPLVHIKSIAYSKADELFLEKINECISENLGDAEFDVEKLAKQMNISKPTLYRKIKSLSDLSPNEIINITRLKKAAELLAEGNYKIYEVANIAGYASQTNFGRNFSKQFGMTPSEYLAIKEAEKNKPDPGQ